MYEILAGSTVIFSDITPATERKVIDPRLTMGDNSAGSLEFTLPPSNIIYDSISCLNTELMVTEDGEEIWRGRVISDNLDFWKNKKIVTEGELAYLNDSIQPPKRYLTDKTPSTPAAGTVYETTVGSFLEALIAEHNSQMGNNNNKKFTVGYVAPDLDGDQLADDDAINRYTNYETTLACILDKLVDRLGGHIRVRHYNGIRYIDYLKDYIDASNQKIEFGKNLLEFSRNIEATEWVTAVIPRGKRKDEEEIEGLEAYTTVAKATVDTWHASNSIVVKNPTTSQTYGFICTVVDWENVEQPNTLLSKAKQYLQAVQFNKMVLEVSAVDLHYLNPNIDSFKMLEEVTCISDAHGMNAKFPVTKMEIDLNNPSNTKYTLGTEVTGNISSAVNKFSNEVYDYIDDTHIPVESVILNSAKANAKALVEGTMDKGYASFMYGTDYKGVPITDASGNKTNPDRTTGFLVQNTIQDNTATNRWIWSYGGLIHQKKVNNVWQNPNIGLTMDGSIVADRITTGIISLTGAKSQSNNSSGYVNNTYLKVYASTTKTDANLIGTWSSEGIWIGKGSLTLGSMRSLNIDTNNTYVNPYNLGLYIRSGSSYVKAPSSHTQPINGYTYYAYESQIDNNGGSVFNNALFTGTIVGSTISSYHASSRSEVYISGGRLKVTCGDDGDASGHFMSIYTGDYHVDFGGKKWGCYNKFYNDSWGWIWINPKDLFMLVDKCGEWAQTLKNIAEYWSEHGRWD